MTNVYEQTAREKKVITMLARMPREVFKPRAACILMTWPTWKRDRWAKECGLRQNPKTKRYVSQTTWIMYVRAVAKMARVAAEEAR